MKREYLDAIERQRAWLDFSRGTDGRKMWATLPKDSGWFADEKTGKRLPDAEQATRSQFRQYERELYEKTLESKDIYYVGPDFCRLIDSARKTLPDDVNFDRTWMPTTSGWLFAETPIILPPMQVDAIGKLKKDSSPKRRIQISLSAWGWVMSDRGVSFCGFQTGAVDTDTGEVIQQSSEFFPLTYFTLTDGQNLRDRVTVFEENTAGQKDYIAYKDDIWQHEVRWIYTAFLMFDQRLLASRKHRVDRGERRRMERAGREVVDDINVVTLRRYLEGGPERAEGQSDEEWYSIRFEVSGHWRQQYYPSTSTHKPLWILPFEKGPKDAPFREKKKRVFAAVR